MINIFLFLQLQNFIVQCLDHSILKKKKLVKLFPKFINSRSQDLKDTYFDVGQFYYANKKIWLTKKIFSKNAKIIKIPHLKSYDLNDLEDWNILNKIKKITNL